MIAVTSISKKYKKNRILQDIHFQISAGERVAIVGKNGCGKTTLMQILAGVIKPDAGELTYYGKNMLTAPENFRRLCGYVPQENPLIEELSVKDNLKLWGAAVGKDYADLIVMFELAPILSKKVGQLSGGMKRRLCIACALIGWPPVLLMDEPTTSLDFFYKESIRKVMDEYKKMKGILLLSTHDEAEIAECDRCLIIQDGFITEPRQGKPDMAEIKKVICTSQR